MTADSISEFIVDNSREGKLMLENVFMRFSMQHDQQLIREVVCKLCLQYNDKEMMKKGLEFLYMNGFYGDLQLLIDRETKSLDESRNLRAKVYQLMMNRKLKQEKPLVILNLAKSLQSTDPDLSCLIEFLKISSHYELRNFGKLGNFLDKQNELLAKVQDSFLLSYFHIRLYEILFTYYWVSNELIMARKYAFMVLNLTQNPKTKASININLALTYTFDTFPQGMYHLEEAMKIATEYNYSAILDTILNQNIPFLAAHHRVTEGISTNNPSELAHLEIAKGNLKKAEEILRKLSIDSPFKMYYLGLATKDKSLLYQSYNYFIQERSDHFFARLPLIALQKMGGLQS